MTNSITKVENIDNESLIKPLTKWLEKTAPEIGTPINLEKFATGQSNPTYRFQTDSIVNHGKFVLRTQPTGQLLKSAHAVDREYRVMKSLGPSAVPVPKMVAACNDTKIIGVKFFVMHEVDGTTFFNPALQEYKAKDREILFYAKIDLLATLAKLDPTIIGLESFGKPSGYLKRQFGTWTRQYRSSETKNIPAMETLLTELPACLEIEPPGICIIHGDFRIDNLLIENHTVIKALIDWELSTLGPAFIDLSYWCAMLRMDANWPIGGLGSFNRSGLGIPDENALLEAFCERTGFERPTNWEALVAFQCFRFAAILQGVMKRHLDGNASAENAASIGSQAAKVAELGANILSKYLAKKR